MMKYILRTFLSCMSDTPHNDNCGMCSLTLRKVLFHGIKFRNATKGLDSAMPTSISRLAGSNIGAQIASPLHLQINVPVCHACASVSPNSINNNFDFIE